MKEHQIGDSEGSGSSRPLARQVSSVLEAHAPHLQTDPTVSPPQAGERGRGEAEATSLRDGNPGTMRQASFCTREGGRCQRRRADGWAKGSEMDGQLLLFRPPPCQASVIKAIHHPPWGGGSLPCSDTTASFSVVHHSGERGVGEQGRGRGSQREPAQQTAKAAPLRRPRPAPNAGSVHWLRPRARHSYWGLRVVVSADEAPWKQG